MIDDVVTPPPTDGAEAGRTESAVEAFVQAWWTMCHGCPSGRAERYDGLLLGRTGLHVAAFNGVWSATAQPSVDAVLRAVEDFAGGDLPWNVQLRSGYPRELDDHLAARGLVRTAQIPFMTITDVSALTALAGRSAAVARQVNTFRDLDSGLSLLERGFGMQPQLTREAFPLRLLFDPSLTMWLLRADDVDVCTALGVVGEQWTGVFNVATPEEHRGRGYGTVATAHAVVGGGGRAAYLQASPMGFGVYARMGFVQVETWTQWMPAAYAGL